MANLATAGAACPAGLADAERWEAVMEQEALRGFTAAVSIDILRFFDRRKRDEGERLGLAALKNRRTMGPREHTDFACDRTQVLITTAVHPLLFVEDADAKSFFLDVIESLRDGELVCIGELLEDGRLHLFLERVYRFAAVHLFLVVESAFNSVAGDLIRDFEDVLVDRH